MSKRRIAASAATTITAALLSSIALAGTGQAAATHHCKVTASAANIRASATTSSAVVGIGYKNQTCTWSSWKAQPDWVWIRVTMTSSHVNGWIREDLLSISS